MAEFFDFDPVLGLRRDFEYDEQTGEARIITSQDISAAVDWSKQQANMGLTDHGIKEGWWKYASIPPIVQIELRQKGLDIYSSDPSMQKRVLKEINTNYAWCKTTAKVHA